MENTSNSSLSKYKNIRCEGKNSTQSIIYPHGQRIGLLSPKMIPSMKKTELNYSSSRYNTSMCSKNPNTRYETEFDHEKDLSFVSSLN